MAANTDNIIIQTPTTMNIETTLAAMRARGNAPVTVAEHTADSVRATVKFTNNANALEFEANRGPKTYSIVVTEQELAKLQGSMHLGNFAGSPALMGRVFAKSAMKVVEETQSNLSLLYIFDEFMFSVTLRADVMSGEEMLLKTLTKLVDQNDQKLASPAIYKKKKIIEAASEN